MAQINEKETTNEVIQNTRRTKKALAKAIDFDIDRILEDAKQKQRKSGRKVLFPPVQQDT